ncbi:DNA helicase [Tanacetum coccineum]
MSKDVPRKISITLNITNLHVNDSELGEQVVNGREELYPRHFNERKYILVPKLNKDQKAIYDLILGASIDGWQELVLAYGHDGTGKTFLWKTIITTLRSQELNEEEKKDIKTFSSWLLETRDGKIEMPDETYTSICSWLQVPDKYCIMKDDNGLSELISFIFDKETLQMTSAVELQQKAIVCSKNEIVNVINLKVTSMLHGESKTYVRSDGATPYCNDGGEQK